MKIKKTIKKVNEFVDLYINRNPPLPPYFKINNKSFKLKSIYYYEDEIKFFVDIVDSNGHIVKFNDFLNKEFVWEFDNYDYIYNYLDFADNEVIAIDVKKYDIIKYERNYNNNAIDLILKNTDNDKSKIYKIKIMNKYLSDSVIEHIDIVDKSINWVKKAIQKQILDYGYIMF